MSPNPWIFKAIECSNYYNGPFQVKLVAYKRDIRSGFDLGEIRTENFIIVENIDFICKSKEYWKQIFMKIRDAGGKFNVWWISTEKINEAIKRIKQFRYECRRPKFKTWEERYSKSVVEWAWKIITNEVDDYCKDNFRVARHDDKKALRKYYDQKHHGCCGSFDVIRTYWFIPYYIGCNYGH
jgi:hypothetical protein